MKTRQSTGCFQQALVILLLCSVFSFVFAGSAFALTGNIINQCFDCHGSTGDIRPIDSTYRNITTGAFVGNHRTHLPTATTLSNVCTPCHGAAPATMDHRNGQINIRQHINSSASLRGIYSKPIFFNQTSAPTLGTCSNVNCHFRTTTTPWGSTALTGGQTAANCAVCHNSTGMTTGNHAKHITALGGTLTACSTCHPNNTTFSHATSAKAGGAITVTFAGAPKGTGAYTGSGTHKNYPNYLDGTGTYNSCNSTYCHGTAGPAWNSGALTCTQCHDAIIPGLTLRHDKHISTTAPTVLTGGTDSHTATAYAYACLTCHPTTQHAAGPASAVAPFQDADVLGTKVTAYTKGSASAIDGKGFNYTTNGNCTTVCHTKDGVTPGSAIVAPNWGTTATGTCGVCHNKAGDTIPAPAWSTPHTKHINTYAANTNITCASCHAGTATNNTTINGIAGRNQHPDGKKDVAMNAFAGGSVAGAQGAQTCSNIYCHGNGTTTTPTVTVSWSGTLDCTGCHPTAALSTGSHSKHLASATCNNCHNVTAASNSALNVTTGTTNHVDKNVSINFDGASATAAAQYNGINAGGTNIYQKNIASAAGTCSNIYCHNNGTGIWTGTPGTGSTPTWGTTGGCNSCHGNATYTNYRKAAPLYVSGTPKPNAHVAHLDVTDATAGGATGAAMGTQCKNCHYTITTDNLTASGAHATASYTVAGSGASAQYKDGDNVGGVNVNVTTIYAYSATPNSSTCSNVSCHPTGLGQANKVTTVTTWDNKYNCTDCHKIDMNNTNGYHHVMDATAMGNRNYPTAVPGSVATDTSRKCTMCHVDHDIFSPKLNASSTGRNMNLRTAISTTPTATTGYTNSDYVAGTGGICISCHTTELSKNTTAQKNDTTIKTVALTLAEYAISAHQYGVNSTMISGAGTFTSNCVKCHDSQNGETTTFQNSTNKFGLHDNTVRRDYASLGATLVDGHDEDFCFRCHSKITDAVGGTKKPVANKDYYNVAAMTNAAEDIYTVFAKTYGHKVGNYTGIHKPAASEEPPNTGLAKHVECADCHDPHAAKPGNHTNGTTIAAVLTGVAAVTPTFSATNWAGVTSYSQTTTPDREYKVCFKCHSGSNINLLGTTGSGWNQTPNTGAAQFTDLGLEFNPNNKAAHPVVVSLNNQTGSIAPKPLASNEMVAPWTAVGTQVMTCSDCHATDSVASKGPHGSAVKWMLAGTNKAWPYTSAANNGTSSGTFWSPANMTSGTVNGLFCLNCHSLSSNTHSSIIGAVSQHNPIPCVGCHIRVPHGGKVSRLIATRTGMPARDYPDGNGGGTYYIEGFKKSSGGYGDSNCGSTQVSGACGSQHSGYVGSAPEKW